MSIISSVHWFLVLYFKVGGNKQIFPDIYPLTSIPKSDYGEDFSYNRDHQAFSLWKVMVHY